MIYFRFNTDKFITSQQECLVSELKEEIYTSLSQIDLIDIFFKKLEDELSLTNFGVGHLYYDLIDIPIDAHSIDDEVVGVFDKSIYFVLSEYAKLPIKELSNKSLNDLGITIEFCKRISNHELNVILEESMKENNYENITEEVLWKNMDNNQKVKKYFKYLSEIGTENNELLILDPYLFACKQEDYCKLLANIFNSAKASSLIIITDKTKYIDECYNNVKKETVQDIKVIYNSDYHDRFWIANRKKGFTTGTSLNGIGKKISLIYMLSDNDVIDIVSELVEII